MSSEHKKRCREPTVSIVEYTCCCYCPHRLNASSTVLRDSKLRGMNSTPNGLETTFDILTKVLVAIKFGNLPQTGCIKHGYYWSKLSNFKHVTQNQISVIQFSLSDLVVCGVGYHHAGMDISDRKTIETMFTAGDLPVLCETTPTNTLLYYYFLSLSFSFHQYAGNGGKTP